MSSSSTKIVAEYAKSSRSLCKKCAKTISGKSLRLGLVSRHPQGFDEKKWHHLDCFPMAPKSVSSVEAIGGFASLESSDQEAVKKLFDQCARSLEEVSDGGKFVVEGSKEKSSTLLTVHKRDDEKSELVERNSKKTKVLDGGKDVVEGSKEKSSTLLTLSPPNKEVDLHITLSVSDIKEKYKDATLPPKWSAFRTVIFLERVIFTNESNIDRWKNKRQAAVDSKVGRLNDFIKLVKVPIQVFIACGTSQAKDPFRKPSTGMWRLMEQHFNSGISIDMNQSFYVGDAAGRVRDHSDADIKFAETIGLKFYLPEEYFLDRS